MITLTYEQKVNIGFQYILERLNPCSPYGQELVRKMSPYTRQERKKLDLELSNLEKLVDHWMEYRVEVRNLKCIFMQMKDIRATLKKAGEMCLSDIELFEIKNFLLCCKQAQKIQVFLKHKMKLEALDYVDTTGALRLLDPDDRGIPTFSIYDSYSEKLAGIRKEKRAIERQLELAETQKEQNRLKEERRLIVVREEAEEQRIREQLTDSLVPYISSMSKNADVTGHLDLLLEKTAAAWFSPSVKPTITEKDFTLEDAVNPWVSSALKERRLTFTPISIALEQGAGVITGANMGGKSIALKTVALNTMLALCGFYVYAKEARIPHFDNLLIVSEEMQSVKQGLSSFGAEIVQLQSVIQAVEREYCFVIFDEFSRGTNPHEGAQLVRAVVRFLNDKPCMALLVTHYDHVAEYANIHYQVVGLKDMNMDQVKAEISASGGHDGVSVIASHMNYGLYRADQMQECPQDAFNICRLLGLDERIMDLLEDK